jgi:hypothetical protein
MLTELLASMVAISAAAHALDALYGQLVTPEIKVAGPRDDKGRGAHPGVLEAAIRYGEA